jgi:hypothetical protein
MVTNKNAKKIRRTVLKDITPHSPTLWSDKALIAERQEQN